MACRRNTDRVFCIPNLNGTEKERTVGKKNRENTKTSRKRKDIKKNVGKRGAMASSFGSNFWRYGEQQTGENSQNLRYLPQKVKKKSKRKCNPWISPKIVV